MTTARRTLPLSWLFIGLGLLAAVAVPVGLAIQLDEPPEPRGATAQKRRVSPLPACDYGKQRTELTSYDDWQRTLLDTRFRLPRSYEPPDLVTTTRVGVGTDEMTIREIVLEDLDALVSAADVAGNPVDITWGYRSFRTQRWVFEYWTEQKGEEALKTAARPGHSEHQLGTALDFKTKGAANVDAGWRFEPAGQWMHDHAWEYGFIESYPLGEEKVTCYSAEPWHFRYFGREVAADIHRSGLTIREYLWRRLPTSSR